MKVAKASAADLGMAFELMSALEGLSGWDPRVPDAAARFEDDEGDEGDGEPLDRDDREQCQRALGHLIDLSQRASLMRVIMGCAVMLDPKNQCVDPDSGAIEHHPNTKAAMAAKQARPLAEWTPDSGAVLWWAPPGDVTSDAAPWVGTPDDASRPATHTLWTIILRPDLSPKASSPA